MTHRGSADARLDYAGPRALNLQWGLARRGPKRLELSRQGGGCSGEGQASQPGPGVWQGGRGAEVAGACGHSESSSLARVISFEPHRDPRR